MASGTQFLDPGHRRTGAISSQSPDHGSESHLQDIQGGLLEHYYLQRNAHHSSSQDFSEYTSGGTEGFIQNPPALLDNTSLGSGFGPQASQAPMSSIIMLDMVAGGWDSSGDSIDSRLGFGSGPHVSQVAVPPNIMPNMVAGGWDSSGDSMDSGLDLRPIAANPRFDPNPDPPSSTSSPWNPCVDPNLYHNNTSIDTSGCHINPPTQLVQSPLPLSPQQPLINATDYFSPLLSHHYQPEGHLQQQHPEREREQYANGQPDRDSESRWCPKCKKVFGREADLMRHSMTAKAHTIPNGLRCMAVDCRFYNKPFTRNDNLKAHLMKAHEFTSMDAAEYIRLEGSVGWSGFSPGGLSDRGGGEGVGKQSWPLGSPTAR